MANFLSTDRSAQDLTHILALAADGDTHSAALLLPRVYDELRLVAREVMAKTPPGNTLTPTALVHEAYLKVAGGERLPWESRRHFFLAASRAMRNILVDQARRKAAIKHGGGRQRLQLKDADVALEPPDGDVIALDEALTRLEQEDPEAGEVVTLLHFSGLTAAEAAAVLQVSTRTVSRRWRFAKAWLHRVLRGDEPVATGRCDGH